jgi:hypothetical protein
MKRKIFTLLLSALLGTVVMAQTSAVVKKTATVPVIDGVADPIWANAEAHNIVVPFKTDVVTLGDAGTTTWKALWSDDGIYVLVTVNDDVWLPAYITGGANWTYDKVELYFDVNAEKIDGGGPAANPGHYQVDAAPAADNIDGTAVTSSKGFVSAYKVADPAYVVEYFVPFSWLKDKDGADVNIAAPIGFDITIIDRDTEAAPHQRVDWVNDASINESWNNMDGCGTITLSTEMVGDGGGPAGPGNELVKVTTPPVIDGVVDALWSKAVKNNIVVPFKTDVVTLGDAGTTFWQGLWDDNGIYVLVTVNDDVWLPAYISGGANWTFDKVELYFDVNAEKIDGGGPAANPGHYQVDAAPAADNIDGLAVTSSKGFVSAYKVADPAYKVEYFVPFSWLKDKDGADVDITAPIGFDITIIDRDTDAAPHQRVDWVNDGSINESWNNMDGCGTIKLKSATKVNQIKNANSVQVYPNPVQTELTVSKIAVSNSKVSIYNSVGQRLMEKTASGDQAKFDVSNFRKGMYFVRFSDGTSTKFIKQ